ncbi:transcription termination/antitermination protei n NusA [Desulfonema ishimotonii]|uniref:Transcription termination/antitermination protein NusA n=1 Tax=Desulfonema ishimotonii TaxID=45657 RepID=A0A401G3Y6_9BACT|nr:transcription termination/antitermination protei n NusA [Desulfonema ishimotonii]
MLITDIKRVIEQVSRDKGIDSEILIRALEEALKSAARKRFGNRLDIEVKYNEAAGEIEVFQFKEVVEDITDPDTQLSMEEGIVMDPDCEIGDCLGTKMDTTTFGRIAAQSAKQVIIQKMKDAEREAIYNSYVNRKGEIINGIVQRFERHNLIVNLGQTEGVLPVREQVSKEKYRRGDRIRAYILDVRNDTHGPQVILSRTHTDFLISLFRTEVPEVSEGVVSIMTAAREPGIRGKIAVASNDSDIDPVGACVGMKGSRVQNVVQELQGEKIDIISWHVDPAKFVCNALAPAEIVRVVIDEENRSMEVIVPDEKLSVAIGRNGQNVRLASKLTRWRLDVKSESKYSSDMKRGYDSLLSLPEVNIGLADALSGKGLFSVEEIAESSVEELLQIPGMTDEQAEELIRAATTALAGPRKPKKATGDAGEAPSATVQEGPAETVGDVPPATVQETPAETVGEAPPATVQETPAETVGETPPATVQEGPAETVGETPPVPVQEGPAETVGETPPAPAVRVDDGEADAPDSRDEVEERGGNDAPLKKDNTPDDTAAAHEI